MKPPRISQMDPIQQFTTGTEEQMGVESLWTNSADGIMTVHNVAHYLRLSEAKVYRMARAGGLPAFRIGKTWRFKKRSIDEWIREKIQLTAVQQVEPVDETGS